MFFWTFYSSKNPEKSSKSRMLVAKHLMVAIDSQWLPSNVWLPTFFKISCVQQKKETHTGLEQVWGE